MIQLLQNSLFFGGIVTLLAYEIGLLIRHKFKLAIFNPLLIAVTLIIVLLKVCNIQYSVYEKGAVYINYLLTPATVALAIPLYEQLQILKKNAIAIFTGIIAGTVAGLASVLGLSVLFGLTHEQYVTLLPKSITTAIGMGFRRTRRHCDNFRCSDRFDWYFWKYYGRIYLKVVSYYGFRCKGNCHRHFIPCDGNS